jgi:hypothetical protein
MNIYLDIETLQTTDEEVISSLRHSVKPPATYRKAESILEWLKENEESATADLVAKTSFDGMYGSIACICWAIDDGEVWTASRLNNTEAEMLTDFYDAVRNAVKLDYHGGSTNQQLTVVGHNVAGFDLPFLKHRSIINKVTPATDIRKAMNAKPWDSCIADTMLMWSSDSQKRASMDKLCKAFGIEGKGDFDGSMVNSEWTTGSKQKVIDYCKDDVRRTRELYKRITFNE